jgi:hypothetical protein
MPPQTFMLFDSVVDGSSILRLHGGTIEKQAYLPSCCNGWHSTLVDGSNISFSQPSKHHTTDWGNSNALGLGSSQEQAGQLVHTLHNITQMILALVAQERPRQDANW